MIGFHNKIKQRGHVQYSNKHWCLRHRIIRGACDCTGFTLIEILVATSVFSILAIIVGGIFMQSTSIQRKGAAAQKVQENALYIFETMAREIRVSKITSPRALECGAEELTMTHPVNGEITYELSGTSITRTAGGISSDISSSDVAFTRLNFCISGTNPKDGLQPRITILTSVTAGQDKYKTTIDLQTTVSSRDLSDEL